MENTLFKLSFSLIFTLVFSSFLRTNSCAAEKDESRVSVVVIDPGHGGKDWGASMGKAKEKEIVLDIALKLGATIKANYPNVKIVYTRTSDRFIPLHQRANIANRNKADLFISIHVNAVDRKSVQGTETFVLGQHRSKDNLDVAKKENSVILLEDDFNTTYEGFDPNLPESYIMFELVQNEYLEQSILFASEIQDQFREGAHRIDRSVKQAGFLVLRRTTMPSVLVETGFLSHTAERNYLLSEAGQSDISWAIFRAFKIYKRKIEEKSSFNLITETPKTEEAVQEPKTPKKVTVTDKEEMHMEKQKEVVEKSNLYFSVQIMALKRELETTPANFKGEENIFHIESDKYFRYYSGKFSSPNKANDEKRRLSGKYPNAFVVAIENNTVISVKKALGKM